MRRGRCKPRFRAFGRNVGQRRAVFGRFRRLPDAPKSHASCMLIFPIVSSEQWDCFHLELGCTIAL
jgi:hypothetical protein